MKRKDRLGLPSILLSLSLAPVSATHMEAQDIKVSGLVQTWNTWMLSDRLRVNSPQVIPNRYYNLRSEFTEDTFVIRRTEIKVSGHASEDIAFEISCDPSQSTGTSNPSTLLDADVVVTLTKGLDVKVGQFKTYQTLEGVTHSGLVPFAERSQLGRMFGDIRDRGVAVVWTPPKHGNLGSRVTVAMLDGVSDSTLGKGLDQNAQKDWVARLDLDWSGRHRLGFYTLQGSTDVKDTTGTAIAPNPGPPWPSREAIYANKDRTTNWGGYYYFQTDRWLFSTEAITGLLGRRFPTLGPAIKREHLHQKYLGAFVTGGILRGHHAFLARYDWMDFNAGNDWYTPYNPYRESAPGVPLGADYTPRYTETTLGYSYLFKSGSLLDGSVKLNYIHRSSNFLKPNAGETGAQGGDSLVLALMVAF